ncbi:MAG: hypothetical protein RIS92_152 [Verrucomicrobiota bacterium]|jgi:hypothetical protein
MSHRLALLLLFCSSLAAHAAEAPLSPEQITFFEQRIRPALSEHCEQCHSVAAQKNGKLKGSLFLDTKAGVLKGGDTGPALIPGKPEESLLVKAVRWGDSDTAMPPKKKLPDQAIEDFIKWVAMGAPDPRTGSAGQAKREINIEEGRRHWAFQPLSNPKAPPVKNTAWPKNDIDRFLLAKQEERQIKPSPQAAPAQLLRRIHLDLIGLPPTAEEVAAFEKDPSPSHYAQIVDRLLERPQYGERWGRHWLDIVRFAESGGYEFDGFRPGAYFYRDWVIKALNADMPYNEFVQRQFAGDVMQGDPIEGAAATGFLVAGPYPGQITAKTKERIRYDQLDDMLSTAGGAMLGLTIGCVRCHDHKYDPITQSDYYSLAASLARTEHGEVKIEKPNVDVEKKKAVYATHSAAVKSLREAFVKTHLETALANATLPATPAPWQSLEAFSVSAQTAFLEATAGGVVVYTGNKVKDDTYTLKFRTLQKDVRSLRLDAFSDPKLPRKGPGLSDNGNFVLSDVKVTARPLDSASKEKAKPLVLKAFAASHEQKNYPLSNAVDNNQNSGWAIDPQQGKDHAATFIIEGGAPAYDGGTELEVSLRFTGYFGLGRFRIAFSQNTETPSLTEPVTPQDAAELSIAKNLDAAKRKQPTTQDSIIRWLSPTHPEAAKIATAEFDLQKHQPRPEFVNVYSTKTGGADVFLLRRGEVDNKAGKAETGFIQVLSRSDRSHWVESDKTHPRIALGKWMTDEKDGAGPLVARVMVNRIWKHHFGKGIVNTANDFGTQGDRPTHPELLDHLASQFIADGWHMKALHRRIVTSAAYQMGQSLDPVARKADPENTLLWNRPARRLEAEAIRDSLLAIAGTLSQDLFGPSVTNLDATKRSIYLRVRRSELIPFLTLFDAPEPTQSIGDRGVTTLPTQALTMLNSPFVRNAAAKLAARAIAKDSSPAGALEHAFRIALSRPPDPNEHERFSGHLLSQIPPEKQGDAKALHEALARTCNVLLCTNEFIYVD